MNARRLEVGAAVGLVGVVIFQVHDVYTKHAGPLDDMRQASGGDLSSQQQLRDADVLAGNMTMLAGGALSIAVRSWYPLALAAVSFGIVSLYYHKALVQPAHTPAAYSMAESAYT
jgi:hypothetical protein